MMTDSSTAGGTEFDLTKARERIAAIPRPEPKGLKRIVAQLADDLLKARAEGCTYAQLRDALGMKISESTLRQYLAAARRAAAGKPKALSRNKPERTLAKSEDALAQVPGVVSVKSDPEDETASQAAPLIAGAHKWRTGTEPEATMEIDEILRAAPGGLIDCNVSTLVTPRGRKLGLGELADEQRARLRAATSGGPSDNTKRDLAKLMREIDGIAS